MFYSLSDSHRAVLYGSNTVILDLSTNQYNVLDLEATTALQAILSLKQEHSAIGSVPTLSPSLHGWINEFLSAKLIERGRSSSEQALSQPLKEGGVKDYTWVLQNNRGEVGNLSKFDILKSLKALITTNHILQKQGIKGIINLLQNQVLQIKEWETPKTDFLNHLMSALDKACQYYPKKVVCLAWASTFAYLCLKRGWFVHFVIGVQLYPFLAHAWVEREGKVIGDREDINSYLGILLREPQHL